MLGFGNRQSRLVTGGFAAAIIGAMLIAACSSSSSTPTPTTAPPTATSAPANTATSAPATGALVKTATAGALGSILVDANGMTLYHLSSDTATAAACTSTNGCLPNWPPLLTTGAPQAGPGVTASLLGTFTRPEGAQVTYKGNTLYRAAFDKAPGDTKGQGITAFGGKWTVVSPSGDLVQSTPAPAATTAPTAAATAAPASGTVTSSIVDFALQNLNITVGTTVIWRNDGGITHTATSGKGTPDGTFDSGFLNAGQSSKAIKFDKAGTFTYYCQVHGAATMSATITVAGSPTSSSGAGAYGY